MNMFKKRQRLEITICHTKVYRKDLYAIIFVLWTCLSVSASFVLQEEFEVTKGVIKIHKSKKNIQHNG
jgi:hypothetical protein